MTNYLFSDFLIEQMEKRDMTAREFARLVGISHFVINKFLEYGRKEVGYPSVEFLLRLAKATQTDIGIIMRTLDPSLIAKSGPDIQTQLLIDKILALSGYEKRVVNAFVDTLVRIPKTEE